VETYVGTTSGTSFIDTSRTATTPGCSPGYGYTPNGYKVKAVFPNGAKSDLGAIATMC
jgi:hypothetical protein